MGEARKGKGLRQFQVSTRSVCRVLPTSTGRWESCRLPHVVVVFFHDFGRCLITNKTFQRWLQK